MVGNSLITPPTNHDDCFDMFVKKHKENSMSTTINEVDVWFHNPTRPNYMELGDDTTHLVWYMRNTPSSKDHKHWNFIKNVLHFPTIMKNLVFAVQIVEQWDSSSLQPIRILHWYQASKYSGHGQTNRRMYISSLIITWWNLWCSTSKYGTIYLAVLLNFKQNKIRVQSISISERKLASLFAGLESEKRPYRCHPFGCMGACINNHPWWM